MSSRRKTRAPKLTKCCLLRRSGGVPRFSGRPVQRDDGTDRCCTPPRAGGATEPTPPYRSHARQFAGGTTACQHLHALGTPSRAPTNVLLDGTVGAARRRVWWSQRAEAVYSKRRDCGTTLREPTSTPDTTSAQAAELALRPNGALGKLPSRLNVPKASRRDGCCE